MPGCGAGFQRHLEAEREFLLGSAGAGAKQAANAIATESIAPMRLEKLSQQYRLSHDAKALTAGRCF